MEDVYEITYDTCGQYWPKIHHYIFLSIALMQVTMIGLFGLMSKPGASLATVPLLVLNILFNEYCKARFLPTFRHRPVQVRRFLLNLLNMTSQIVITNLVISRICTYLHQAANELDEAEGTTEGDVDDAICAYRPPWMRPTNLESSYVEPLNV